MGLRKLQDELPWGAHDYTKEFNERKDAVRDFEHAHGHAVKALGGLFEHVIDECAHKGQVSEESREKARKKLADVVICAVRMANTLPGGSVALARAVEERLTEKFPRTQTPDVERHGLLCEFEKQLSHAEIPAECVDVWLHFCPPIEESGDAVIKKAWGMLCKRAKEVGRMRNAEPWLRAAISNEAVRRLRSTDDGGEQ